MYVAFKNSLAYLVHLYHTLCRKIRQKKSSTPCYYTVCFLARKRKRDKAALNISKQPRFYLKKSEKWKFLEFSQLFAFLFKLEKSRFFYLSLFRLFGWQLSRWQLSTFSWRAFFSRRLSTGNQLWLSVWIWRRPLWNILKVILTW